MQKSFFVCSMMKLFSFFAISFVSTLASPIAEISLAERATPSLPLPVTILNPGAYQLGSWFENLAVRSNGQILVTRLDTGSPQVILYDPTGSFEPVTVYAWNGTEYRGCLGISETNPDVFYVIASAFIDTAFVKTSGVNSIFEVDMNTFAISDAGVVTQNATVTKVVDITESDSLNGMATLDDSHILVGDIYNGWVYNVDTTTGAYAIAINDTYMKAPAGSATPLGVNGLKIHDSHVYWTNSARASLYKLEIDSSGAPVGNTSVVLSGISGADDFTFRGDGTLFISLNSQNSLGALLPGTTNLTIIAGGINSTDIQGDSACKFGRLDSDSETLYLTLSGGKNSKVNGTYSPAAVASVDTVGL